MTLEEVRIREAVRYTIELYNQNADRQEHARHHEVFHPEAEMVVEGGRVMKGPDDIITTLVEGARGRGAFTLPNFQRHHLTSIMIEVAGPDRAFATAYVMVLTELGIDHAGAYRDEFRPVGDRWMIWRRDAKVDWMRTDSRFYGSFDTQDEDRRS
jgi:SnoaL-like domain